MLPRRSNNLLSQLGPFFAIIGTSLFALQFAQKAKFEFGPKNSAKLVHSMEELGLKSEESLEEIYKGLCDKDLDNWENVRGPRNEEDNQQFIRAKEEREKYKEQKKKQKSGYQKVLNNHEYQKRGDDR